MRRVSSLTAVALLAASLTSQTVVTVGGTNSAPSRANTAKANMFQVDSTVLLQEIEMFLDVPGPETLTWFVYRHHSRTGASSLLFQTTTNVTGGTGAGFYSSGPIVLPLVCGNHYLIGCSWAGTVTYHYNTSSAGSLVAFGNWQRGNTLTPPLPATYNFSAGTDIAQYYQRLTTLPLNGVDCGPGAACTSTTDPRLVANGSPLQGASFDLDVVEATGPGLVIYAFADGPPLTSPTPLRNCSVWLDLSAPITIYSAFTNASGEATQTFPVPVNPLLQGFAISVQAGILSSGNVDMTNVLGLVVN